MGIEVIRRQLVGGSSSHGLAGIRVAGLRRCGVVGYWISCATGINGEGRGVRMSLVRGHRSVDR